MKFKGGISKSAGRNLLHRPDPGPGPIPDPDPPQPPPHPFPTPPIPLSRQFQALSSLNLPQRILCHSMAYALLLVEQA